MSDSPQFLELYKNLFLEALLDDGVVSDEEEASLADFAQAVGLSKEGVRDLRASVRQEPRVATQLAELQRVSEEPPEGLPDEGWDSSDGPAWDSDEFQRPAGLDHEDDDALASRRSRLRVLRGIAREAGACVNELDASCLRATCNAESPEVQAQLRQAAAGEIELEFAPLETGLGGLAVVWPEAGRNLLREVKAVAGWRLAFVPSYVTPERRIERVQHKQGWLYFRAGDEQGVYVRFGSKRGAQVSVFVGFGSEAERDDPVYSAAREQIVASAAPALGPGWTLEASATRLTLEAKRTLSCEAMTDPAVVLSVSDALVALSGLVAAHLAGCTLQG